MPGRWRQTAILLAGAGLASGCEAIPAVQISVHEERGEGDAVGFVGISGRDWAGVPDDRTPVQGAFVVVCKPDDDCPDPSQVELFAVTFPQVRSRAYVGAGARPPAAMRTDEHGTARYAEYRALWPLFATPAVERRVRVWADGFEPRDVLVDIGTTTHWLSVPLRRR